MRALGSNLLAVAFLLLGCDDGARVEETDAPVLLDVAQDTPREDTNTSPDVASDTTTDTHEPDTGTPDAGSDTAIDTTDTAEPGCPDAPRIYPAAGPPGTVFEAVGYEVYIGALQDWALFGEDTTLSPVYLFPESGCGLPFVAPPLPPGEYPVYVYYGEPGGPWDPGTVEPWGTFTLTEREGPVGTTVCEQESDCASTVETCDLGLGVCVPNLCASLHCSPNWPPGPCDSIAGCVSTCSSDADCKLISSDCGCQAVHVSDPRDSLTACELGACEDCGGDNRCAQLGITAVCEEGVCTEALP